MRIGLIGKGKWGTEIHRVLTGLGHELTVCDPTLEDSASRFDAVRQKAVVIATPPQSHAELCHLAIEYGTPFFVEKPVALDVIDAARIAFQAQNSGIRGAVGHIALHQLGYQKHKYPTPKSVEITRYTKSPGYHGVTAWWDIGVHDVAVCVDLHGRPKKLRVAQDEDSYTAVLWWDDARAVLHGDRTAGRRWDFTFDGETFTPYDDPGEPLKTELEWWLDGGSNLDDAAVVVETLVRGSE